MKPGKHSETRIKPVPLAQIFQTGNFPVWEWPLNAVAVINL
jgi:hypothetical protein